MRQEMKSTTLAGLGIAALLACILACVGIWAGWQQMKVFSARKSGEATLIRAEQEKQVMVEQAKAEVESAELRAEAIRLVGKAAQEFPEYRSQEFIGAFGDALREGKIEQIIYVPTEASLPIVEAGRMQGRIEAK